MKKICTLLTLLLLVNFTACASKDDEKEQAEKDQAQQEQEIAAAKRAAESYKPKLICPQVAIIRELDTINDFGADPKAAGQLVAGARMQSVSGDCGYQDEGIDIAFTINFAAARGPRLVGDQVQFPFFVTVVDPSGKILNKDQQTLEFRFKSDDKISTRPAPMHVFIPLPKEKKSTGPNYRVLAGFQLSEQQLKDVRSRTDKTK